MWREENFPSFEMSVRNVGILDESLLFYHRATLPRAVHLFSLFSALFNLNIGITRPFLIVKRITDHKI